MRSSGAAQAIRRGRRHGHHTDSVVVQTNLVQMANHHDNFDNINSKFQPWNSVNVGPKKDIVGIWQKHVTEVGMKFGVSVHGALAWNWYEDVQGR